MNIRTAVALLGAVGGMYAQEQSAKPKADIIFVHGNVYTGVMMASGFSAIQRAEAIAVRGDRILAVGDGAELLKLKGAETRIVDLGGKFVMPGFNDAHAHLAAGGAEQLAIDLVGVKSLEEMKQRIAQKAAS